MMRNGIEGWLKVQIWFFLVLTTILKNIHILFSLTIKAPAQKFSKYLLLNPLMCFTIKDPRRMYKGYID